MQLKTVREINLRGKTVLLRADYNVPIKDGVVADDRRIRESLATLTYLRNAGAERVVIMSHLGRPEGRAEAKFSLAPVAKKLASLIDKVSFCEDLFGKKVYEATKNLPTGGILLLENLRFDAREEANEPSLMADIVRDTKANVFVQDGFAVVHRAHASTVAITRLLPSVAGLLVEKELCQLDQVITKPKRPLLVIVGGAKVADKTPFIRRFLQLADEIAVGGKIAADGYKATEKIYVAEDFISNAKGIKLDIGPKSRKKISEMIARAQTIIWNGTIGMVEEEAFRAGSLSVALAMGRAHGKITIVGGGDTTAFVGEVLKTQKEALKFTLLSTGGGASLAFLSGEKLPGIEALKG